MVVARAPGGIRTNYGSAEVVAADRRAAPVR
jgi:hypothetical protein